MPTRLIASDYLTNRESLLLNTEQVRVETCQDSTAVGYVKQHGSSASYLLFKGKQSRPVAYFSAPNIEQARLRVEQLLREAGTAAERRSASKSHFQAEYHETLTEAGITRRSYTTAGTAKAIRESLKQAFGGQKFSVTTEKTSSITVRWENGPLAREVEPLLARFEAGYFDSSQDMYVQGKGQALITEQGTLLVEKWGAKYVFCYRQRDEVQQQLEEAELAWLAEMGE